MQSYCFLEIPRKSGESYQRLQAMEEATDWFRLAQIDLQYRGAGEILGTRQSGESDIPLQRLMDEEFVSLVSQAAHQILEKYPALEWLPALHEFVHQQHQSVLI
jgi:ATP-dependent DNA helicase RecG